MSYLIPIDIEKYLLSVGFLHPSQSVFTLINQGNNHLYKIYISKTGQYELAMEAGKGSDRFEKTICTGYIVEGLADIKFLIEKNSFMRIVQH